MAGFGYGLPISRLYAQYFGGDIAVMSADTYGTDAYVWLKCAPQTAVEVLPEFRDLEIE